MKKQPHSLRRLLLCITVISLLLSLAGCDLLDSVLDKIPGASSGQEVTGSEEATLPTEAVSREPMAVPDLAEYVEARTVTVTAEGSGTGSGFFIDDNGTIVTNYHVIDGASNLSVQIPGGATYEVTKIVDFSEPYDLAVLRIDVADNLYLSMPEEKVRTGDTVYAMGSSLGFLDGTFSDGIVSTASRSVGVIDCIQTTAAISHGNSGGPLVNVYGEVVGVNAFSYSGGESLNLAININMLSRLDMDKNWNINRFREWYDKEISRSYLFYSYDDEAYYQTKVNTYQYVTGETCVLSALTWDFLDGDYDYVVEGYDTDYGIFVYEYDADEFDAYTDYLNSIGFDYQDEEAFNNGTSYYYYNEFDGYFIDFFVLSGDEVLIIEPTIE